MEKLLERIRRELQQQGMSLRELGRRSGIHHSLLSRLLRGELAPTPRLVGRLAPALGVDLGFLYNEAGLGKTLPLEEALKGMGIGEGLDEARLTEELAALAKQATTPAGDRLVREAFPRKRKETALRGPVLECMDELYALYTGESLPPEFRAEVGAALLYFISPTDCIPDDHFPLGYLDDALVIQRVWGKLSSIPVNTTRVAADSPPEKHLNP